MKQVLYEYKNLPIPGGGYVTGFLYHRKKKDVLYARTDIGGTYRFDAETQQWISLISHVSMKDLSETFPVSMALDDTNPAVLYIACGINAEKSGVLAVSEDYGEHFRYEKIPVMVHGNLNGRGTGERLVVDRKNPQKLYYASQQEGLWVTGNRGREWYKNAALPEEHLAFAVQVGRALVVSSAGVTRIDRDANMRGRSLYVSYDDGGHFEELPEPQGSVADRCRLNGLVAQRCASDGKYLYVTFASTGRRSYVLENGYSCDSGDTVDGRIARYELLEDGRIGGFREITPVAVSRTVGNGLDKISELSGKTLDFGFSGIDVSTQTPGMLVCTTIVKDDGDSVFRSYDYGESWQQILYDLDEGEITFRAPYMQPECNGGHSLIHWLSDIKINPHDDNEAWFNTGTGVFRTRNLRDRTCCFTDWCDGIEETVHLNVYAMPKGDVQVVDIVGDLGGFAFTDLDKPCANSFADSEGNRYITCINADFSDKDPHVLIVTPRGNWTGKTKGGLILSRDQGRTFTRLKMPFGLDSELDGVLKNIENPNVNSGWVAMSPDCQNIVWSVADGISLPVGRVIVSHNAGVHFSVCKVYALDGNQKTQGDLKIFSDRVDSSIFYAFGDHSDFYVSRDGGSTYHEYLLSEGFPRVNFGLIDCANKTEIRAETGKQGVFYMAIGEHGLWKLEYNSGTDVIKTTRLSREGDSVFRMGLGLISPGSDYYKDNKAIYFNGIIDGEYGFYRTVDEGKSYERLNTDRQMYGEINSIDGDCRVFGRFYLATGSNGVKYGEPVRD